MEFSVPFVARIDAGIALLLGVLMPRPPIFVLIFIRSTECIGISSLFVIDLIMDMLMSSNSFAVSLSQLSQAYSEQADVRAYA